MAGDEDGPARRCQASQQQADPPDAVGVEPVGRLVEDQHARIAEQRGGDAEALAHAEGELARPLAGGRLEPDHRDHLIDAAAGDVVGLGQHPQVRPGRASRMDRLRLQQRADLAQRPPQVVVGTAVHGDLPPGWVVQAHDHPHRRRLARAVRSEEPGDDPWPDGEGQVIDGRLLPVALGQVLRFDHAVVLA